MTGQCGARRKPGWDALRDGILITTSAQRSRLFSMRCDARTAGRDSVVPGASRGGMPSATASSSRPPPNALGCSASGATREQPGGTAWCPAQAGVGCPPRRHPHHDPRPTLSAVQHAVRRANGRAGQRGARRKPGWEALRDGILITTSIQRSRLFSMRCDANSRAGQRGARRKPGWDALRDGILITTSAQRSRLSRAQLSLPEASRIPRILLRAAMHAPSCRTMLAPCPGPSSKSSSSR
jgi:hypothetical protein